MIQEQLGSGCMEAVPPYDHPSGRVMSDVTSMFLLYIVELYQWSNDTATIDELWPNIEKAIAWQIASTADVGIPAHMIDTYDILRESHYLSDTYSAMFFLMSMKACDVLATAKGNATLVQTCNAAFTKGQDALDALLWTNGTFYAMGTNDDKSIMADCMYGQVLAYTSGFGSLLKDPSRLE